MPKSEPVSVKSKLRKVHPWFEIHAARIKQAAINARRRKERGKGPALEHAKLVALADELEEIQRQLNPLENRRREITEALLAHWGHTGIEEIEGALGCTLISTSFEMCLDAERVRQLLDETQWLRVTERVLQAQRLLFAGESVERIREIAAEAAEVRKLKISITSPSSRRPKSAEAEEGEAADES